LIPMEGSMLRRQPKLHESVAAKLIIDIFD
jgi:hypothetical protein